MLKGCKCNRDKKGEQCKWDKGEGQAHAVVNQLLLSI